MEKKGKKVLTEPAWADITLSDSEKRIIYNIRLIAERDRYGTLTAELTYHNGSLQSGHVTANKIKL